MAGTFCITDFGERSCPLELNGNDRIKRMTLYELRNAIYNC